MCGPGGAAVRRWRTGVPHPPPVATPRLPTARPAVRCAARSGVCSPFMPKEVRPFLCSPATPNPRPNSPPSSVIESGAARHPPENLPPRTGQRSCTLHGPLRPLPARCARCRDAVETTHTTSDPPSGPLPAAGGVHATSAVSPRPPGATRTAEADHRARAHQPQLRAQPTRGPATPTDSAEHGPQPPASAPPSGPPASTSSLTSSTAPSGANWPAGATAATRRPAVNATR